MDKSDAQVVLRIMTYADSGCQVCVHDQFKRFLKQWPEYARLAEKEWYKQFQWEERFQERENE